ncbi:MAG: hypothetical protein Kow00122_17940 [Thermoleophilia bacterium]
MDFPPSVPATSAPPRVAVYDDFGRPPRVTEVPWASPGALAEELGAVVREAVRSQGGGLPPVVVQELIDNLVHAEFTDVVITVYDGGNALRVSDHGPGIPDKERALRPGFTTAHRPAAEIIRGVGSGFALVREALARLDGSLEIEDNLGCGTVVTARVPRSPEQSATSSSPSRPPVVLSDRQLRTLLLIVELGPVGPTRLATELGVSASTAYRDLVELEEAGFVEADARGRRIASEQGLAHLEAVL